MQRIEVVNITMHGGCWKLKATLQGSGFIGVASTWHSGSSGLSIGADEPPLALPGVGAVVYDDGCLLSHTPQLRCQELAKIHCSVGFIRWSEGGENDSV